jgi:hypothetical protein
MSVLTYLRNRGVKDVFFVVCDGLKGLPDVVSNVWRHAIVQTCIIHLLRNTFRLREWFCSRGARLGGVKSLLAVSALSAGLGQGQRHGIRVERFLVPAWTTVCG